MMGDDARQPRAGQDDADDDDHERHADRDESGRAGAGAHRPAQRRHQENDTEGDHAQPPPARRRTRSGAGHAQRRDANPPQRPQGSGDRDHGHPDPDGHPHHRSEPEVAGEERQPVEGDVGHVGAGQHEEHEPENRPADGGDRRLDPGDQVGLARGRTRQAQRGEPLLAPGGREPRRGGHEDDDRHEQPDAADHQDRLRGARDRVRNRMRLDAAHRHQRMGERPVGRLGPELRRVATHEHDQQVGCPEGVVAHRGHHPTGEPVTELAAGCARQQLAKRGRHGQLAGRRKPGETRRHRCLRPEGSQVDAMDRATVEAVLDVAPQERVGGRLVLRRPKVVDLRLGPTLADVVGMQGRVGHAAQEEERHPERDAEGSEDLSDDRLGAPAQAEPGGDADHRGTRADATPSRTTTSRSA